MKRRAFVLVAVPLCAALLAFVVTSCGQSPPPTVPAAPTPTTTPWRVPPTPEPTTPRAPVPALSPTAGTVDPGALLPYLPDDAQVAGTVRVELDGDAEPEVLVLLGLDGGSGGLGYDHLEMMVLELDHAPDAIAWRSSPLVGQRAEGLQVRDINGDGRDEVLSYQAMGATGYTLYVVGWGDAEFGLVKPQGGYFAGLGHFGDVGVRLEDLDRDGVFEILASYGPAGTSTDVYKWDGSAYVFGITLRDK